MGMPNPFFYDLNKTSYPLLSSELSLLQQASRDGLRISTTLIVPPSSFTSLAEELKLFSDLKDVRAPDETTKTKFLKKMAALSLPKTVIAQLHRLYHGALGGGFVRMRGWTQYGATPWISEIKGDSNLAESLVTVWQMAAEFNLRHDVSLIEAATRCQVEIQQQPAHPVACGEVFTRHPITGERHLLVIRLWPGAPHAALHNDTPSQYTIDVRTGTIVQRQVGSSKQKAKRRPDAMVLERGEETAEFNDDGEILDFVREINVFKRKFPHHLHATFEIDGTALLITALVTQSEEYRPLAQPERLATQVYVATGSADALDIATHEHCDGIGLLRAEYVFSRLGTHPLSLLGRGREQLILDRLTSFFKEVNQSYPSQRIVYRLQNFTSQELQTFSHGESQEKEEPNPYLGWRGGLRLMEQPQLFEPELQTFAAWLKRRHAPTGLVVPFVRSSAEWRWIINRWKERHFFEYPEFENWFQITTPENITNLEGYVLAEVHGISLNIRTVTALMTGTDPDDPQLQASYPPPIELQQSILSEVRERVDHVCQHAARSTLKLHLHLEDYNNALVSSAVKLRYDGIVLHPAAVHVARSSIGVAERDRLFQSSLKQ